jgi:ketosteroid isomerase-like protein
MTDHDAIGTCEVRLRRAMLASDLDELVELLDDALVFIDHHGARRSKQDDLAAYRSGVLAIASIDRIGDADIRLYGNAATVCVTVDIAGTHDGSAFSGTFAYSRVWRLVGDRWQVVLAHCSRVPATS